MQKFWLGVLVGTILGLLLCMSHHASVERDEMRVKLDSVSIKLNQPEFFLEETPNVERLFKACDYYGIKHPEVVVAQALLESGFFRSDLCIDHHNLFGLYNSYVDDYYHFDHWTESVKAYRDKVQYKYDDGDYYEWLQELGYAKDTLYIPKVKNLVKKYKLGVE